MIIQTFEIYVLKFDFKHAIVTPAPTEQQLCGSICQSCFIFDIRLDVSMYLGIYSHYIANMIYMIPNTSSNFMSTKRCKNC